MRTLGLKTWLIGVTLAGGCLAAEAASTNSWSDGSGKWESSGNWSLGAPSALHSANLITNAGNNTVTVDAATPAATLLISNLTVAAPPGNLNTLQLTNAPGIPLRVFQSLYVSNGAALLITNASLRVDGLNSGSIQSDGNMVFDTGTLITTNASTFIGSIGQGSITISNGTWLARDIVAGTEATAQGTITFAGGSNFLSSALEVGFSGTGTVWMTGGQLAVTNDRVSLGDVGDGRMIVSNGTLVANKLVVGFGTRGTFTAAGGSNNLSTLTVGALAGGTGAVWITGGQTGSATAPTFIGSNGVGQVTVSNGGWLAGSVVLGYTNRAQGTLTIAGGASEFSVALIPGFGAGTTGTVWVTSGSLVVTGASDNILGFFGVGSMTVSNGTTQMGRTYIGGYPFSTPLGDGTGTLTVAGGTASFGGINLVEGAAGSGALWVTGGELESDGIRVSRGAQIVVSNGVVGNTDYLLIGSVGSGTLTMAGGTNDVRSVIYVGPRGGQTGTIWMTGGRLVNTNTVSGPTFQSSLLIGYGDGLGPPSPGVGRMTVSNGTVLVREVIVGYYTNSEGTLTLAGGNFEVQSNLTVSMNASTTGSVIVAGGNLQVDGTLILTNASGSFRLSSGTVSANNVNEANGTDFTIGQSLVVGVPVSGQLTLSTGTHRFRDAVNVGSSTGTLVLASGQLVTTNADLRIGYFGTILPGVGVMIVSNGTVLAQNVYVASGLNSRGSLTVAGGTITASVLNVGQAIGGRATLWLTGGQLIATNGFTIGDSGIGQVTISNGTVQTPTLTLARSSGSVGTLTAVGGNANVYSNVTLGNFACTATGIVTVTGGNLLVTNATGTAVLEVRSAKLQLDSGTLMIDRLVITNACGHFVRTGGTLITATNILTGALDADGDGIPNGYEQTHGLDPLDSINAAFDSDGDGLTDLQEYLAGTDPTNSTSAFRITSILRTNNDVRITWMMGGGKTNALQRGAGDGSGGFATNNFATMFIVTNTVGTVTNYLDVGGATNVPSRFYRVRLVP